MSKRIIYFILLVLVIADCIYSFNQFKSTTLDGDMAGGIVPGSDVRNVLESPLGFNAAIYHQTYPNPNRFFSHYIFKAYFSNVPLLLQNNRTPIDSVYLSCAIAKILIQLFLIILLAMNISGTKNFFKLDFIIAAILVIPFFQTHGYQGYMGIIDESTTYSFFYALPLIFLMIYFTPIVDWLFYNRSFSFNLPMRITLLLLACLTCLSGPLNPGVILIITCLVLIVAAYTEYKNSKEEGLFGKINQAISSFPKKYFFFFLPISFFALYSIYIGHYNSISNKNLIPLSELYAKLPAGIYYQFTQKIGFPILFIVLTLNSIFILKLTQDKEGRKILGFLKWTIVFSMIYILLLPLGGYRNYRPNILRYDTILPITIGLIFCFGITSLTLIKTLTKYHLRWYLPLIAIVLFIFTNADAPHFKMNECEKNSLIEISEAKEKIIELKNDCPVLSWKKITRPQDSELNAKLLLKWRIIKEPKLYFNGAEK